MDEVLNEGGLFEVGTAASERESGHRAGVEGITDGVIRVGGDRVAVIFVEEEVVGLKADFPFLVAGVNGDGGVEISVFKIVVLDDNDGPGVGIGIEVVGVVADHAADVNENVGRENVLIGSAAHGLEIIGGLELGRSPGRRRRLASKSRYELGIFLHQFVGNFITGELVTDDQT